MTAQDELNEWPKELMLRDAKVYDDLGGLGQRIFTTAGVGKKVKYVRADLVQSHAAEAAGTQPPAASVTFAAPETEEDVMAYLQIAKLHIKRFRETLQAALAAQENPNG